MRIIWKSSILFILTIFLFYLWSSNFMPLQQSVKADSEISNSTIGGQEVNSLKKSELISLLNLKILEWKEKQILLTGDNMNLTLLPEWFTFDVEGTVDQYLNEVDKPWFAFWKSPSAIHIPLQFSMDSEVISLIDKKAYLDKDKTLANIISQVGILSSDPIETVASDFSLFQAERIAFSMEEITINSAGLDDIISALNDQIIESGEVFSLLDHLKDIHLGNNNEAPDFVTSMIYSVLLQTNYEILERHSQDKIPPYLEPGVEAKIDENTMEDLKFVNPNNTLANLKISIKDSKLLVELYSVPIDTVAKYQVRDRLVIKPRTIYRYSSELSAGHEELIQEGEAGLRVFVYRTISDKVGPFEKEELISQDYYPPINRIILKSSLASETPLMADSDLAIDMNGDGLPDIEQAPSTATNDGVEDGLPEGYYYDKAGNIIKEGSE